jgi:hypothetical protein
MICGLTAQRPSISASTTCMTAGDGRTVAPRIRISRPDVGSARCNASRARAQPEVPLNPRRRIQHFQRPTPSHVSSNAARATRRGNDHVARGRRGGLRTRKRRALAAFARQCDSAALLLFRRRRDGEVMGIDVAWFGGRHMGEFGEAVEHHGDAEIAQRHNGRLPDAKILGVDQAEEC